MGFAQSFGSEKWHLSQLCAAPVIQCLLAGDWPMLESLHLSVQDVEGAALMLSGSSVVIGNSKAECWTAAGRGPPQWPCVNVVCFGQS